MTRNELLSGTDVPQAETRALRAGPLRMLYEAGDLRYVRLGEREVVRRLYAAVRDRNWGTVPNRIRNERVEAQADSFRITYDVENRAGEIDFTWQAVIEGEADGTVRFRMEGEARSTFLRNRIGFCVLHPMRECAGAPCVVEHPGGVEEPGKFPRLISPHQPFFDIVAIRHRVLQEPEVWADIRFEGDLFEMEDQRNWTDASFKTYCTPLRLPFPVEIPAGTRVSQSVTLTLLGELPTRGHGEASPVRLSLDPEPIGPLPQVGLGAASHGQPLTEDEQELLLPLKLAHLRVDVALASDDWETTLERAAKEAELLFLPLEVALTLSTCPGSELDALRAAIDRLRPRMRRWIVFHAAEKSTTAGWVRLARRILADYDPAVPFFAGTPAYFTELNRGRPPVEEADGIAYSINPQVHAFDNRSLVETLEAQAATVESARAFAGGKPLAVGPVTFRPRFNPDATGPEPAPAPGELPGTVDPRQASLVGAAWTLGSLKYLAESGVESVTYYETSGWKGLMETRAGSPLPERFPSIPGAVFPLWFVFAAVGALRGGEVLRLRSAQPLQVDGLAVRKNGRTRLLLANMTGELQEVELAGITGPIETRTIDESNVLEVIQYPAREWEIFLPTPHPGEEGLKCVLQPYAVLMVQESP